MKIEIWSDVVCPFCYIGKRKFEAALGDFPQQNSVQVVWKSFQLAPDMVTDPNGNGHEYLARHKNMSLEQARELNDNVASWAREVGLTYNFDKAVVANTFKAHRYSHFAKDRGKQNEAEEQLFRAYFTEGLNIDDAEVLVKLGGELGLETSELRRALASDRYSRDVEADVNEAHALGIHGVPFYVFDRKYAVSGAQDVSVFAATLQKAWADSKDEK